jgi:hypothetical protein
MSNASFTKSIGGSRGSSAINSSSVGLGQSKGSPVAGYDVSNKPKGAGTPPPQDNAGPHK